MTINDDNWKFLHQETGLSMPFNDMYFRYLRDLGYTGTLQDMIAKSKLGLNPSTGGTIYPFKVTEGILGAGGLDYALYDSSALDHMWQESTGQTLAALTSPVGLIVGREKEQSKTFAQVMAGQPDLKANFSLGSVGSTTAASFNPATGVGSLTRVDASNQSFIRFNGLSPIKDYLLTLNVPASDLFVRRDSETGGVVIALPVTGEQQFVLVSGSSAFLTKNTVAGTSNFTVVSLKEVPAHYASQAVNAARPVLQADGLKFDGSDDNLLTDWLAQAGANCIIAQVTVPATPSVLQIIAGENDAGSLNRFWLGIDQNTGRVRYGVGNNTPTVLSADLRGTNAIIALVPDGVNVRVLVNNAPEIVDAQSGVVSASIPFRLGALNNNGNAVSFFSGSIKRVAFGKTALTFEQFQQIRAEWLAAA